MLSARDLAHGDRVLLRALYPLTLVSANIYTGWILVMPLLRVVQNEITGAAQTIVHTTTISETFGSFNVIATVIIIGPLSVIFVFRVHRTLSLSMLQQRTRRLLFLALVTVQYTMFVVLRYDALKGPVHYAFTGATFLILYLYHASTTFVAEHGEALAKAKLIGGSVSALCIFCFLSFIVLWQVDETPSVAWTATCICEVVGALALASLDIIDLYVLRMRHDSWFRAHAWDTPELIYWQVLRRCLYYSMAAAVVLFSAWVFWVPLLGLLWPALASSPSTPISTISFTFSTYNVVSTIFLVGPLCIFFFFHVYRIAFSLLLSHVHRRALFVALVVLQYSLFVVLRADAIRGAWHYVFTGIVFVLIYWYHLAVADANVQRAKLPVLGASAVCILFFGSCIVLSVEQDGLLWLAACTCEVLAVAFIAVLESIDVLDFVTDPCDKRDAAKEALLQRMEDLPVEVDAERLRGVRREAVELPAVGMQNRQRKWYEAVLGIRPRAVPLGSMQQHGADVAKINDHNRQRKWYEAVQPAPAPPPLPSFQKQVFAHAPPEVTVEGALRRARENGQRLWYDSAPRLPRSSKPPPPAPMLLGNFDGVMQQVQVVQPPLQPYAPHDLWAETVPGTVWTEHKKPDEWVQNFGAESRAHAWEVPVGPEPRMVEAVPTVASQFFQAYDVGQRVPMEFFVPSQTVARAGSQFFEAYNVGQQVPVHVYEEGGADHAVLTKGGFSEKRAADDAETENEAEPQIGVGARPQTPPQEMVQVGTQKRAPKKNTGLFSDSSSKKRENTAVKNEQAVFVGNMNESRPSESMRMEFSYDNPSMMWAGLDKLWNDA